MVLAVPLGGCGDWDPDFDPPRVVQIACSRVGAPTGAPTRIFRLDTGARTAVWFNGPGAPKGRLTVSEEQYGLAFLATGATVNRFDGRMTLEEGRSPFLQVGVLPKTNRRSDWLCVSQPEGPRF
jgi:hypothetical protein